METPSFFLDFLKDIRPTQDQLDEMRDAHRELKERIEADSVLKPLLVSTFIQGSYRRHTALKAHDSHQCDVDVVVVTRFDGSVVPPRAALDAFKPFLDEHYPGNYEPQGRSWGIKYSDTVNLDLVPTAAPSESMKRFFESRRFDVKDGGRFHIFESYSSPSGDPLYESIKQLRRMDSTWQLEPLEIPDREASTWDKTHPLAQIEWTTEKNGTTNGHYVNVVKSLKWWRRVTAPLPKYPKGYPLEHLIGAHCPNGITSVAEGVVKALEAAVLQYQPIVDSRQVPYLHDHGFPVSDQTHNVLGRVSRSDFAGFFEKLQGAASTARKALDSNSLKESTDLWRTLFGDAFPEAPDDPKKPNGEPGGFTKRAGVTTPATSRFG